MGSTILLVEDDPDIQHLVSYKLGRAGLEVIGVTDGVSALPAAREHRPDLVLLDVRLPRLSGLEICRALRDGPVTAGTPIIMLTARSRPQDFQQAYAAGATDYIVKPFSPRDLLARVESALGRVSPLDAGLPRVVS